MAQGRKKREDTNETAFRIVSIAVGESEPEQQPASDPAAVARGVARAKTLSPERRREIARKAAQIRWEKKNGHP